MEKSSNFKNKCLVILFIFSTSCSQKSIIDDAFVPSGKNQQNYEEENHTPQNQVLKDNTDTPLKKDQEEKQSNKAKDGDINHNEQEDRNESDVSEDSDQKDKMIPLGEWIYSHGKFFQTKDVLPLDVYFQRLRQFTPEFKLTFEEYYTKLLGFFPEFVLNQDEMLNLEINSNIVNTDCIEESQKTFQKELFDYKVFSEAAGLGDEGFEELKDQFRVNTRIQSCQLPEENGVKKIFIQVDEEMGEQYCLSPIIIKHYFHIPDNQNEVPKTIFKLTNKFLCLDAIKNRQSISTFIVSQKLKSQDYNGFMIYPKRCSFWEHIYSEDEEDSRFYINDLPNQVLCEDAQTDRVFIFLNDGTLL
jgi:hypothetical protein